MTLKVAYFAYGILKVLSGDPSLDPVLYLLITPDCHVNNGDVIMTPTGLPLEDEHDADLQQGNKRCVVNEIVRAGI